MKTLLRITLILLTFSFTQLAKSQEKFTLSGYMKDGATGEDLIGATIFVKEAGKGVATNVYGFYSITLPAGQYEVVYSLVGMTKQVKQIDLTQDVRMNIELDSNAELEEVVVSEKKIGESTQSTDIGKIDLAVSQIKTLPAFMGEVDILKTIQFLPGVQSGGEGSSGFYVRGGGPDQNLILLDEAVVYNASHLFGFFSVFNADAVKNIELTKGGMPARYGGRLASVLDITMKDGNSKHFEADGGIGLIASRLTLQGPLIKDKSSFIVSGRRTYIDVLTKPFIPDSSNFAGSGYYFYDVNAKLNYRLSDKDRLFLSGYFGRDVFTFNDNQSGFTMKVPWGNATTTLRWNHLFSDKLFMNASAIFSDYKFSFEGEQSQFEFKLFSGIRDWNGKLDFSYFPSVRHSIQYGVNYTFHQFIPSSVSAQSGDTEFDLGDIRKIFAHETAFYVSDDFDVTEKLRLHAGLRYSTFAHVGPFTRFYKDQVGATQSTTEYAQGEVVKFYGGFEPRASLRYKLTDSTSIKAAFTRNYQYVHLASISSVSLPTDIWFPSTDVVQPQLGTQANIGYFQNFKNDKYEFSVEAYYKTLENLIEYKDGATPDDNVNDNVDSQLTFGSGSSYGLELFLKKATGQLTGWIGYTWSKTMRTFEDINGGTPFPAKYDRRHDLSIIANYQLNEKWTFGGAFVYATGNAITLPVERYLEMTSGKIYDVYGDRNSLRMVPYHRADVSVTYTPSKTKTVKDAVSGEEKTVKKKFSSSWNFSVYNVYNRRNPYFIYFSVEGNYFEEPGIQTVAKQVSLFPILPAITWNFSF